MFYLIYKKLFLREIPETQMTASTQRTGNAPSALGNSAWSPSPIKSHRQRGRPRNRIYSSTDTSSSSSERSLPSPPAPKWQKRSRLCLRKTKRVIAYRGLGLPGSSPPPPPAHGLTHSVQAPMSSSSRHAI